MHTAPSQQPADALLSSRQRLTQYLRLTKPGIVFGNALAALGGFFLGTDGLPAAGLLAASIVGIALVIAAGCTFNNIIDRDIDPLMHRTRQRALASGTLRPRAAMIFGLSLSAIGLGVLQQEVNTLTMLVVLFGLLLYVVPYSLLTKRRSIHATLVGSLAGATPALAGYTAATGQFDPAAALLFLLFCLWQVPHSHAIGLFRQSDFRAAGIPLTPLRRGYDHTRVLMLRYIAAWTAVAVGLGVLATPGPYFSLLALALGSGWLWLAWRGGDSITRHSPERWARQQFRYSVLVIALLSLLPILTHAARAVG